MIKSPFPWFGGKSRVAAEVWRRFGDVPNYVEPFFGSGAVLLGRPHSPRIETINDLDCMVANFWRALQNAPDEVAAAAVWPVNEADLHARHTWLVNQYQFREKMHTDPDFYDAKIAGWWVWGQCCWIGSGWCSKSSQRKRPHLSNAGRGVHRQQNFFEYINILADRLRRVRVCCGDWQRILGPSPTVILGTTAVFLDPPYLDGRKHDIYACDSLSVAHAVRRWCIAHGDDPKLRIAMCGYDGNHAMPDSWSCFAWKASGGYRRGNSERGRENASRERIWFSPHCLPGDLPSV